MVNVAGMSAPFVARNLQSLLTKLTATECFNLYFLMSPKLFAIFWTFKFLGAISKALFTKSELFNSFAW